MVAISASHKHEGRTLVILDLYVLGGAYFEEPFRHVEMATDNERKQEA
jgi:hypothetical protein